MMPPREHRLPACAMPASAADARPDMILRNRKTL